jgi:hypothetical protein
MGPCSRTLSFVLAFYPFSLILPHPLGAFFVAWVVRAAGKQRLEYISHHARSGAIPHDVPDIQTPWNGSAQPAFAE